jgi:hypothetical protein
MSASIYNRSLQVAPSVDDEKVEDSLQANGCQSIITLFPEYLITFEMVIREIVQARKSL